MIPVFFRSHTYHLLINFLECIFLNDKGTLNCDIYAKPQKEIKNATPFLMMVHTTMEGLDVETIET